MQLSTADWVVILLVLAIVLGIGIWTSKRAGKDSSEYFLGGRSMPWWLLGISMVATTFSADTPNLVADIVRQNGVAGNWVWWAFCITGMITVFIYAKLWRKSEINTDLEIYELRYSGKAASFLRGFRAVYLGLIFNVFVMAAVMLAAIKMGEVILGWPGYQTIGVSCVITLVFSLLGGFRGVVLTDMFLFIISMAGAIFAAYFALQHTDVQGLSQMIAHPNVADSLSFIPDFDNKALLFEIFLIPIAIQWWAAWYPGAEPGGGGYIAQRMLSAKDENHALGATFLFNLAHYGLRPWPWIIVALASLIVYPDLDSIQAAFPSVSEDKLGHDLAYPAMLTTIPSGFFGLVLASILAAVMSTISTHLNWGASYLVFDFYERYVNPNATEKSKVFVGRLTVAVLIFFSALMALYLTNAKQIFDIIVMFGAGTGLLFLLRWFWWRINAWSELSAMIISGIVAILVNMTPVFEFIPAIWKFPFGVLLTTISWLAVTYLTPATDEKTLVNFYNKIRPGGPGWTKISNLPGIEKSDGETWIVPQSMLYVLAGCLLVYSTLFGAGYMIYGQIWQSLLLFVVSLSSGYYLFKNMNTIKKMLA